jgi:hypothetical protein
MRLRTLLFLAVVVSAATSIGGQSPGTIDPSLLSGVTLRAIGPASVGGRVDDFAVGRAPGRPDAIYVASASGGVFKSVNGGVTWSPIFDKVDAMMSIGAIAVSKSNPNIVWVGTGEANTGRARRGATASTNRLTRARRGSGWGWSRRAPSGAS